MTIVQVCKNGKRRWRITYREGGKTRRKFLSTKGSAETFADELSAEADGLGPALLACNASERSQMLAALRRAQTGGYTLADACAAMEARRDVQKPAMALGELRAAFLMAKKSQRLRPKSLSSLSSATSIFTRRRETMPANQILPADISAAIADPNLSAWRHRSMLIDLGTWFKWAVDLGHLQTNPCTGVPRPIIEKKNPCIHHAAEVERILRAAERTDPEMVGYGAVGYLAGLRPESEMERLQPAGIREIIIRVELWNKTRRRRDVMIRPALAAWLEKWQALGVPLCPGNTKKRWAKIRKVAGFKDRQHDVMRHTFVSAHYELFGELETVKQAGHSAQELHASYRDLMTKQEAESVFSVLPDPLADYAANALARQQNWRRRDPKHMLAMTAKRLGRLTVPP